MLSASVDPSSLAYRTDWSVRPRWTVNIDVFISRDALYRKHIKWHAFPERSRNGKRLWKCEF